MDRLRNLMKTYHFPFRILLQTAIMASHTGGERQYTQWVHCEFIVGAETICLAHTQRVNGGHFQKVPSTKPSGYFLNEPTLFFGKVSTKYPEGIL